VTGAVVVVVMVMGLSYPYVGTFLYPPYPLFFDF
jgi:hypothetical protein